MTETVKRVCVIGSGASGLPAIKTSIEDGFEVVCFERGDDLGGLWNFSPKLEDGKACCMKSTVINSSKESQAYSDFPPPKELPNFMHNSTMLSYFRMYAEHFGLTKYIRFGCEVSSVEPLSDSSFTKWRVTYLEAKKKDGVVEKEQKTEEFDAVMVCSGHHSVPYIPEFEGIKDFTGEVHHSHTLRDYLCSDKYAGKRVVVIGIGNSGLDASTEVSQVAKKTHLVTRRGAWILSRYQQGGLPTDFLMTSRIASYVGNFFGQKIMNAVLKRRIRAVFNLAMFNLLPTSEPTADHPYIADGLLNALSTGRISIVRAGIKRFTARTIEFTNGERAEDVDIVLMCTGYSIQSKFLSEDVFRIVDNRMPLYKRLAHTKFHTLMFIGYIQPFGSITPISEMQTRFATAVFKRELSLPSKAEMEQEIEEYDKSIRERYVASLRHTIQVDFVRYMDSLAIPLGIKPDLHKLFLSDRPLFRKVMMEGCTPYQYRLQGRHSWSGAREAIMHQRERIEFACAPGKESTAVSKHKGSASTLRLFLFANAVIIVAWLLLCWTRA